MVLHRIRNNSGKGDARYYWYDHVREGKKVVTRYVRPALPDEYPD